MKQFILDTLERCLGTFCESLIGSIGATALIGDVDWIMALSVAGLATLVCVLKCVAAKTKGDSNSASLVK